MRCSFKTLYVHAPLFLITLFSCVHHSGNTSWKLRLLCIRLSKNTHTNTHTSIYKYRTQALLRTEGRTWSHQCSVDPIYHPDINQLLSTAGYLSGQQIAAGKLLNQNISSTQNIYLHIIYWIFIIVSEWKGSSVAMIAECCVDACASQRWNRMLCLWPSRWHWL